MYIAACSCPDLLDNCDLMTGQCSNCPPLVEGRSCNVCVANSFGDPGVGCTVSDFDADVDCLATYVTMMLCIALWL